MSDANRLLGSILICALVCGPAVFANEVAFEGSFVWVREDQEIPGDLRAVFTPADGGEWTVAFQFDWEDTAHVFDGSAKGSLTNGVLEGTAESDDQSHPLSFRFQGTVTEGTFEGTHGYYTHDGSLKESGTLRLAVVE